jgi:copper chaperone CopZ
VRSALAELDGIEESDVVVDYDKKTATVDFTGTTLDPEALMAAFEGTRFTATL